MPICEQILHHVLTHDFTLHFVDNARLVS